jgi:hypothetical protein
MLFSPMDRKKECVKLRLERYVVEFLSLDALTQAKLSPGINRALHTAPSTTHFSEGKHP